MSAFLEQEGRETILEETYPLCAMYHRLQEVIRMTNLAIIDHF